MLFTNLLLLPFFAFTALAHPTNPLESATTLDTTSKVSDPIWNNSTHLYRLSPTEAAREPFDAVWTICETKAHSPLFGDAVTLVNWIGSRDRQCRQDNKNGRCTQMGYFGSAHAGVCGNYGTELHCSVVAKYYHQQMLQACEKNGRVQGYLRFLYKGSSATQRDYNLY